MLSDEKFILQWKSNSNCENKVHLPIAGFTEVLAFAISVSVLACIILFFKLLIYFICVISGHTKNGHFPEDNFLASFNAIRENGYLYIQKLHIPAFHCSDCININQFRLKCSVSYLSEKKFYIVVFFKKMTTYYFLQKKYHSVTVW